MFDVVQLCIALFVNVCYFVMLEVCLLRLYVRSCGSDVWE
jgi:hypothetical protein